jgi:Secretion system C-terminal sorting domain
VHIDTNDTKWTSIASVTIDGRLPKITTIGTLKYYADTLVDMPKNHVYKILVCLTYNCDNIPTGIPQITTGYSCTKTIVPDKSCDKKTYPMPFVIHDPILTVELLSDLSNVDLCEDFNLIYRISNSGYGCLSDINLNLNIPLPSGYSMIGNTASMNYNGNNINIVAMPNGFDQFDFDIHSNLPTLNGCLPGLFGSGGLDHDLILTIPIHSSCNFSYNSEDYIHVIVSAKNGCANPFTSFVNNLNPVLQAQNSDFNQLNTVIANTDNLCYFDGTLRVYISNALGNGIGSNTTGTHNVLHVTLPVGVSVNSVDMQYVYSYTQISNDLAITLKSGISLTTSFYIDIVTDLSTYTNCDFNFASQMHTELTTNCVSQSCEIDDIQGQPDLLSLIYPDPVIQMLSQVCDMYEFKALHCNSTFEWKFDGAIVSNDSILDIQIGNGPHELCLYSTSNAGGCSSHYCLLDTPIYMSVDYTKIDASCENPNGGSIDLTITNAVPPVTIDWLDLPGVSDPEDRSGLSAGTYTAIVTDSNGCLSNIEVIVHGCSENTCVEIINDSLWCDDNHLFWNFCVKNPDAGTLSTNNAIQLYFPDGEILVPSTLPASVALTDLGSGYYLLQYFANPLSPGNVLCGITLEIHHAVSTDLCLSTFGHYENVETGQVISCCQDTNNVKCLTVHQCYSSCAEITSAEIQCVNGAYQLDLAVYNASASVADYITLHPLGMSPDIQITSSTINPGSITYFDPIDISSLALAQDSSFCFELIIHHGYYVGAVLCDSSCTSGTICVPVPECASCCGSWNLASWSTLSMAQPPVNFNCGDSIYTCSDSLNIQLSYTFPIGCTGTLQYELFDEFGLPISYQPIANGNAMIFPAPQGPFYTVIVTPVTNNGSCDPCTFTVVKECVQSCCGSWTVLNWNSSPADSGAVAVNCGDYLPVPCNANQYFHFEYSCNDSCTSSLYYSIINQYGDTIAQDSIPNGDWIKYLFTISGNYQLTIHSSCGGESCGDCFIKIHADCPEPTCCNPFAGQLINLKDNSVILLNHDDTYVLDCNSLHMLDLDLTCPDSCAADASFEFFYFGTLIASGSGIPHYTSAPTLFDQPGLYKLLINRSCGSEECDNLVIFFSVDCNIGCCNLSTSLSINLKGNSISNSNDYSCGQTIDLNCNDQVDFNPNNTCYNSCPSVVTFSIWNDNYTSLISTGTLPAPFSTMGVSVSGLYHMIVSSNCNGVSCEGCIIDLNVNCPNQAAFSMYPNPTSDKITITSKNGSEFIHQIVVFDNMGNVVKKENYIESTNIVIMDISAFGNSLYSIQVNGQFIQRIVKE